MFTAKIVGINKEGKVCAEVQTQPLQTDLFVSLKLFDYDECCTALKEESPNASEAERVFVVYHNLSKTKH